jgi:hypothetical protein
MCPGINIPPRLGARGFIGNVKPVLDKSEFQHLNVICQNIARKAGFMYNYGIIPLMNNGQKQIRWYSKSGFFIAVGCVLCVFSILPWLFFAFGALIFSENPDSKFMILITFGVVVLFSICVALLFTAKRLWILWTVLGFIACAFIATTTILTVPLAYQLVTSP